MRSGRSFATCFFRRRNSKGRSLADRRRRAIRWAGLGILAARLVGLGKLLLVAEVTGLNEIGDAPQIEQAVLQRRAGERQAMIGLHLLDRLRHLRAGVLDELRLVENQRAERELLQFLEVAAQQRVVGDDQIVLRDLFPQVMPGRAAFQDEHLQSRA